MDGAGVCDAVAKTEYATLITTEPEPQYDIDASFRVVWISDAERFDYKACE